MGYLNNMKKRLINNGWGQAIELLNLFQKYYPKEIEEWKKTGSSVLLRDTCSNFKNWSMYRNQKRPLPFDNDWTAIDACWREKGKSNNE